MSTKIYPNSVPEFRVLEKENGEKILQVRYINSMIGYVSRWSDIPTVKEENGKSN